MVFANITSQLGEPVVAAWERITAAGFAERVAALCAGDVASMPRLIAVDGRSGAGKTTVATLLQQHLPAATTVHTDDVAWYESFFGWDGLLAENVLQPVRGRAGVEYRPDAWAQRGREGAIVVPEGRAFVIVEGCGIARRSLAPFFDLAVWVQSDAKEAERRGVLRDGGTDEARQFWREWKAQELPFFLADRPWERAALFVCGTPGDAVGGDVLIAPGCGR
jgi:pantothenate kinase